MARKPSSKLKKQIERALELEIDMDFMLDQAGRAVIKKVQEWPRDEQIDFVRQAHEDDDLVADLLRMTNDETVLHREQLEKARKRKKQAKKRGQARRKAKKQVVLTYRMKESTDVLGTFKNEDAAWDAAVEHLKDMNADLEDLDGYSPKEAVQRWSDLTDGYEDFSLHEA